MRCLFHGDTCWLDEVNFQTDNTCQELIDSGIAERMIEEINTSAQSEKERGFKIYRDRDTNGLIAAEPCEGYKCSIRDRMMPTLPLSRYDLVGSFHTHPRRAMPEWSRRDRAWAFERGHKFVCIGAGGMHEKALRPDALEAGYLWLWLKEKYPKARVTGSRRTVKRIWEKDRQILEEHWDDEYLRGRAWTKRRSRKVSGRDTLKKNGWINVNDTVEAFNTYLGASGIIEEHRIMVGDPTVRCYTIPHSEEYRKLVEEETVRRARRGRGQYGKYLSVWQRIHRWMKENVEMCDIWKEDGEFRIDIDVVEFRHVESLLSHEYNLSGMPETRSVVTFKVGDTVKQKHWYKGRRGVAPRFFTGEVIEKGEDWIKIKWFIANRVEMPKPHTETFTEEQLQGNREWGPIEPTGMSPQDVGTCTADCIRKHAIVARGLLEEAMEGWKRRDVLGPRERRKVERTEQELEHISQLHALAGGDRYSGIVKKANEIRKALEDTKMGYVHEKIDFKGSMQDLERAKMGIEDLLSEVYDIVATQGEFSFKETMENLMEETPMDALGAEACGVCAGGVFVPSHEIHTVNEEELVAKTVPGIREIEQAARDELGKLEEKHRSELAQYGITRVPMEFVLTPELQRFNLMGFRVNAKYQGFVLHREPGKIYLVPENIFTPDGARRTVKHEFKHVIDLSGGCPTCSQSDRESRARAFEIAGRVIAACPVTMPPEEFNARIDEEVANGHSHDAEIVMKLLTAEEEEAVRKGFEWGLQEGGRWKNWADMMEDLNAMAGSFGGGGAWGVPFLRLIPWLEEEGKRRVEVPHVDQFGANASTETERWEKLVNEIKYQGEAIVKEAEKGLNVGFIGPEYINEKLDTIKRIIDRISPIRDAVSPRMAEADALKGVWVVVENYQGLTEDIWVFDTESNAELWKTAREEKHRKDGDADDWIVTVTSAPPPNTPYVPPGEDWTPPEISGKTADAQSLPYHMLSRSDAGALERAKFALGLIEKDFKQAMREKVSYDAGQNLIRAMKELEQAKYEAVTPATSHMIYDIGDQMKQTILDEMRTAIEGSFGG